MTTLPPGIFDLSRLPGGPYNQAILEALGRCDFDFERLRKPLEALDRGPIVFLVQELGDFGAWAHPTSSETSGPAIGLDDGTIALGWRKDYLGRTFTKAKVTRRRSEFRAYRRLGYGEWTLAVILHEVFHHVGFHIVDADPVMVEELDALTPGPYEHHAWIPYALEGYTTLSIPELTNHDGARARAIIG